MASVTCPHCGNGIDVGSEAMAHQIAMEMKLHQRPSTVFEFEKSKPTKFQPNCSVNGHQEYWEGVFHGFFSGRDGPVALVETSNGSVLVVRACKIGFNTIGEHR